MILEFFPLKEIAPIHGYYSCSHLTTVHQFMILEHFPLKVHQFIMMLQFNDVQNGDLEVSIVIYSVKFDKKNLSPGSRDI